MPSRARQQDTSDAVLRERDTGRNFFAPRSGGHPRHNFAKTVRYIPRHHRQNNRVEEPVFGGHFKPDGHG
jgi:hypothetical protein